MPHFAPNTGYIGLDPEEFFWLTELAKKQPELCAVQTSGEIVSRETGEYFTLRDGDDNFKIEGAFYARNYERGGLREQIDFRA